MLRDLASLLALSTLLALSVCDGATEEDVSDCPTPSLTATGSFDVTFAGRSFEANCFDVGVSDAGELIVIGIEAEGVVGEQFVLTIDGQDEGVYEAGAPGELTGAEFLPFGDETSYEFTSGQVTLARFTDDRVRGAFDLVTDDGATEASGEFDIQFGELATAAVKFSTLPLRE